VSDLLTILISGSGPADWQLLEDIRYHLCSCQVLKMHRCTTLFPGGSRRVGTRVILVSPALGATSVWGQESPAGIPMSDSAHPTQSMIDRQIGRLDDIAQPSSFRHVLHGFHKVGLGDLLNSKNRAPRVHTHQT
jgi:hypothetical protein